MTEVVLDREYVWSVGNDVHEGLFPREKKDGSQPLPLPVCVRYQPAEDVDVEVLFVPMRTVRWVGQEAPDVPVTRIRVVTGHGAMELDLAFGREPEIPVHAFEGPVIALIRAVAGVEIEPGPDE